MNRYRLFCGWVLLCVLLSCTKLSAQDGATPPTIQDSIFRDSLIELKLFNIADSTLDTTAIFKLAIEKDRLTSKIQDMNNEREKEVDPADKDKATITIPWLWVAGTAATFFLLGFLLHWLFSRKRKHSGEVAEELENAAAETPVTQTEVSSPEVNSPSVEIPSTQPAPVVVPVQAHPLEGFLNAWESLTAKLGTLAKTAKGTTEIKQILIRLYEGRGVDLPGFRQLLEGWQRSADLNTLNEEEVIRDISAAETQKNLTWLYRLQAISDISAVNDYFLNLDIDSNLLKECRKGYFDLISDKFDLRFDFPEFGKQYETNQFDLVALNIGSLSSLDGGELLNILDVAQFTTSRPIIDVGELALKTDSGTIDTDIQKKYPDRTTVAYYAKN